MSNQLTLLQTIIDKLCCLIAKDEPTVLEIESSSLQGCWQDASTGEQVSIEIVRNEDGSFKSYEIHTVAGIVSATTLAGYEPCVETLSINVC